MTISKLFGCMCPTKENGAIDKKEAGKNAAKITAVVLTVLVLAVAVLATLVNFGVLGSPLTFLASVGPFGSGALLVGVFALTLIAGYVALRGCCNMDKLSDSAAKSLKRFSTFHRREAKQQGFVESKNAQSTTYEHLEGSEPELPENEGYSE